MIERLRENGLRLTPQRLELVRILEEYGRNHPSFSEIYEIFRNRHATVSQSTVLKNLATFEELGLLRSFSYLGETRFELNPTPHVNLVSSNGAIVDIGGENIKHLLEQLVDVINEKTGNDVKHLLVLIQ